MIVAPPRSTDSISLPRREKSAERIEGAISTIQLAQTLACDLVILGFHRLKSVPRRNEDCYGVGRLAGDGRTTGGGRLFESTPRFAFALAFAFDASVALRFSVLLLTTLKLAFRFPLAPARLPFMLPFALPFAFLFATFGFMGLFSFKLSDAALFSLSAGLVGVGTASPDVTVSPSFAARLISTATVWPAFTISPAPGSCSSTVSGCELPIGRVARTRKFRPAPLMVDSALALSLPTISGTLTSGLRKER